MPDLSVSDALSPFYTAPESQLVDKLRQLAQLDNAERQRISADTLNLVQRIRADQRQQTLIDRFLQQYPLQSDEGVALMRLAEGLIRIPDSHTRRAFIRDRLGDGDWKAHAGRSKSPLINRLTNALQMAQLWITMSGGTSPLGGTPSLLQPGDWLLQPAARQAMNRLGNHFIMGHSIEEALRKASAPSYRPFTFSFDMLGEAAHTAADAERHFADYLHATEALIAAIPLHPEAAIDAKPGISVKLSALHPRYELRQADRCVPELVQRLKTLALPLAAHDLEFTIDAEECDRLELSLLIVEQLLADPDLAGWNGLGLAVQAYQKRAHALIPWLAQSAERHGRRLRVRLVKGAYWDFEIKRAQQLGLPDYPVFTRKENTDLSYLACMRLLLSARPHLIPCFATHNAHSAAALLRMAESGNQSIAETGLEFQCIYGMGDALHRHLCERDGVQSRLYVPVGKYADLLPYLVRRLLENGANSSFVHQLADDSLPAEELARDPLDAVANHSQASNPVIAAPRDHLRGERLAAAGLDLTQLRTLKEMRSTLSNGTASDLTDREGGSGAPVQVRNPANRAELVGTLASSSDEELRKALYSARVSKWCNRPAKQRAATLARAGDRLEAQMQSLIPLLVREAGKTLDDALDEVREAVDFCRYYAHQCEHECADREPLGIAACISPWNFPLAIFCGQVVGALAAGNAVVAKPAEQTPLTAALCADLLHAAGVPKDALQLVIGDGETTGAALVGSGLVDAVCFTGSTATARSIAQTLRQPSNAKDFERKAGSADAADIPLIAETGGINAMIVDSTALPEQAVADLVRSAFLSAGQRCSACRLLCVQEDIADDFIAMLTGAMAELRLGDPADPATDIGPIIDDEATAVLRDYVADMKAREDVRLLAETPLPEQLREGRFVAPVAFGIAEVAAVEREIFGPVLHCLRFKAQQLPQLLSDINALGFGLTMGLHTRIESRVAQVAAQARVGNLYVNRNQVGAVVGVQPFGGERLSGTGPKAGGPFYLRRLSRPAGGHRNKRKSAAELPAAAGALPAAGAPTAVANNLPAAGAPAAVGGGKSQTTALHAARRAQRVWCVADRGAVLRQLAEEVQPQAPALAYCLAQAAPYAERFFGARIELPGPTGEDNSLNLAPRGVLLCLGGDEDERTQVLGQQVAMSLAAGNAVIALPRWQSDRDQMLDLLRALGPTSAPAKLLQVLNAEASFDPLTPGLDGVVVDGAAHTAVMQRISLSTGALLPVLSARDESERFCIERTLSVDTTAAGGNASLLVRAGRSAQGER